MTSDLYPARSADQTVVFRRSQQQVDSEGGRPGDGLTDRRPGLERTADGQQLQETGGRRVRDRWGTGRNPGFSLLVFKLYLGLSSVEGVHRRRSEAGGHLAIISEVGGHAAELCGQTERLPSGGGGSLNQRRRKQRAALQEQQPQV